MFRVYGQGSGCIGCSAREFERKVQASWVWVLQYSGLGLRGCLLCIIFVRKDDSRCVPQILYPTSHF